MDWPIADQGWVRWAPEVGLWLSVAVAGALLPRVARAVWGRR